MCPRFSLSRLGVTFRVVAGVSRPVVLLFRLPRRCVLGNELVIELLVADMKELLAALRIGVGRARRILWLVGMALVGGRACDAPNTFIWLGGIQGASKWIRPRMCCGMRKAVANAYMAPAECARMENFVILRAWHIA